MRLTAGGIGCCWPAACFRPTGWWEERTTVDPLPRLQDGGGDYSEDALPAGWFSWRKLWLFTGPGFLMSIAYLVRRRGSDALHPRTKPKDPTLPGAWKRRMCLH